MLNNIIARSLQQIVGSARTPHTTQTELVEVVPLAKQVCVFWVWTLVWYAFASVGEDPIRQTDPLLATDPTHPSVQNDDRFYRESYQLIHYGLYFMLILHQTVCIQLDHFTREKHEPWTRILVFIVSVMGLAIVIYTLLDNVNAKACLLCLVVLTSFLECHYLASIIHEVEKITRLPLFVSKKSLQQVDFNTAHKSMFDVSRSQLLILVQRVGPLLGKVASHSRQDSQGEMH